MWLEWLHFDYSRKKYLNLYFQLWMFNHYLLNFKIMIAETKKQARKNIFLKKIKNVHFYKKKSKIHGIHFWFKLFSIVLFPWFLGIHIWIYLHKLFVSTIAIFLHLLNSPGEFKCAPDNISKPCNDNWRLERHGFSYLWWVCGT